MMKKTAKYILILLLAGTILSFYKYVLVGYPQNLIKQEDIGLDPTLTYAPFSNLDMEGCTAYLFIHKDDVAEAPPTLRRAQCWKTNCPKQLKELQRLFVFQNNSYELATCESRFILKRGNTVIYMAEIVVTNGYVVVQGGYSGCAESKHLEELLSLFERFEPSSERFLLEKYW